MSDNIVSPSSNKTSVWVWMVVALIATCLLFIVLFTLTYDTHSMDMLEYGGKAFISWFMGFFPMFEIYGAVPASYLLGLGLISSIIWAVYGNLVPIWVIHYGYEYLMRHPRTSKWLGRLGSERVQQRMNRYGIWAVLILTPWTGIWAMAITARALGMNIGRLFVFASISIITYAVIIAVTMDVGVQVLQGG